MPAFSEVTGNQTRWKIYPDVYFTTARISTTFNHSIPCTEKGEYVKYFGKHSTTHGKCQDFYDTFQCFPSSKGFPLV